MKVFFQVQVKDALKLDKERRQEFMETPVDFWENAAEGHAV